MSTIPALTVRGPKVATTVRFVASFQKAIVSCSSDWPFLLIAICAPLSLYALAQNERLKRQETRVILGRIPRYTPLNRVQVFKYAMSVIGRHLYYSLSPLL